MTDKLDDVWTSRDYPVLREVARNIDSGKRPVPIHAVMAETGLSNADVKLAANALVRRGLVSVDAGLGGARAFTNISSDAYLLTGLHPSGDDAVTRLIEALRQAADLEPDPIEKSRLRGLADQAGGISRTVLGGVLTAVLTHQIPGAGG